eukprot:TRINITY_DN1940_c0_g1_i3.p1 TRINITY_DN1940_c0_g1~~TRINITY_DN1940_c0_g1_i3.p1  ORF type:complete len:257 (-),score=39.33 TRINITY_DN1940_c0_g1_i3:310-1080(-)
MRERGKKGRDKKSEQLSSLICEYREPLKAALCSMYNITSHSDWYKKTSTQLKTVPFEILFLVAQHLSDATHVAIRKDDSITIYKFQENAISCTEGVDTDTFISEFREKEKISSLRFWKHVPLLSVLTKLYPSVGWIEGKFPRAPSKTWNDREKTRKSLLYAAHALGVKQDEDWYRVSIDQMESVGLKGALTSFGSLSQAVSFAFPEIQWDMSRFRLRSKKATQRMLSLVVSTIFPSLAIVENYFHPSLFWGIYSKN